MFRRIARGFRRFLKKVPIIGPIGEKIVRMHERFLPKQLRGFLGGEAPRRGGPPPREMGEGVVPAPYAQPPGVQSFLGSALGGQYTAPPATPMPGSIGPVIAAGPVGLNSLPAYQPPPPPPPSVYNPPMSYGPSPSWAELPRQPQMPESWNPGPPAWASTPPRTPEAPPNAGAEAPEPEEEEEDADGVSYDAEDGACCASCAAGGPCAGDGTPVPAEGYRAVRTQWTPGKRHRRLRPDGAMSPGDGPDGFGEWERLPTKNPIVLRENTGIRTGLYGFVDLSRRPFPIQLNARVLGPRKAISLIHEMLHVWCELNKIHLPHITLHQIAVGIHGDLVPVLDKINFMNRGERNPG